MRLTRGAAAPASHTGSLGRELHWSQNKISASRARHMVCTHSRRSDHLRGGGDKSTAFDRLVSALRRGGPSVSQPKEGSRRSSDMATRRIVELPKIKRKAKPIVGSAYEYIQLR